MLQCKATIPLAVKKSHPAKMRCPLASTIAGCPNASLATCREPVAAGVSLLSHVQAKQTRHWALLQQKTSRRREAFHFYARLESKVFILVMSARVWVKKCKSWNIYIEILGICVREIWQIHKKYKLQSLKSVRILLGRLFKNIKLWKYKNRNI